YRDSLRKVMTVPAEEFIRLFMQHSLPSGFQRIRYYGFLANCHRADKLELCRNLLATPYSDLLPRPTDYPNLCASLRRCPKCGIGTMVHLQVLFPCHAPVPMLVDTS
ncbi:MAG TPA: transposase, partial [Candidatus Solibacter sp.]|nr:transposase [Candidatus Solibacter sp.]